jgi:ketosteroid isomerase-like protein
MSQENVEVVAGGFAARAEGRTEEWTATYDPAVEWDISAHPLPDWPERGTGRDALMQHLDNYFAGWLDYETTVSEVIDAGDDVLVVLHERARMRGSDAVLERDLPQLFTVRNGLICNFRVFKTRRQALDAAGLAG